MQQTLESLDDEVELLLSDLAEALEQDANKCFGVVLGTRLDSAQKYCAVFLNKRGIEEATAPVEKSTVNAVRYWHLIGLRMSLYHGLEKNPSFFELRKRFRLLDNYLETQRFFALDMEGYEKGYLAVLTPVNPETHPSMKEYAESNPLGVHFFPK